MQKTLKLICLQFFLLFSSRKAQPVKAEGLPVSEKKSDTKRMVKSPDKGGPPRGIAKFDYAGETTDDLSFKVGLFLI